MASKQRKRRRKRRAVKKAPPLPPVSAQAEEEKARTRGRRSAKGWRACLFGIGLLCALWTALAVSLPPTVLRGVVESQLSEAVNAPVTIESLSVNPFTLGIAVRGVRVPYLEETGTPDGALLTIERLDIRPRLRPPRIQSGTRHHLSRQWVVFLLKIAARAERGRHRP